MMGRMRGMISKVGEDGQDVRDDGEDGCEAERHCWDSGADDGDD